MAFNRKAQDHLPLLFCPDQCADHHALFPTFTPEHFMQVWDEYVRNGRPSPRHVLAAAGASSSYLEELASRLHTLHLDMSRLSGDDGEVRLSGGNPIKPELAFFFRHGRGLVARKIWLPSASEALRHSPGQAKVRILLVYLNSPQYPLKTVPLATITLGGYLRDVKGDAVDVEYLDLQLESEDTIFEKLRESRYDIVGLSAPVGAEEALLATLQRQRNYAYAADSPLLVVGNVLPTYAADDILLDYPHVICALGRGELALAALVCHVQARAPRSALRDVPGIAFTLGSTIYETAQAPFALSSLGVADWEALAQRYPLERYQEVWLEASRGCPQKKGGVGCSFCAIMPNGDSRAWLPRSYDATIQELFILASKGVKHVRFADEEFMAGQTTEALSLAKAFVKAREQMIQQGLTPPTFDFAIRVDDVYKRGTRQQQPVFVNEWGESWDSNTLRRQALATFKQAGLVQVYLGIESGARDQLKRFYKAALPEDNSTAIKVLRELGIRIAAGWIMFDPLMKGLQDLRENVRFVEENRLIPQQAVDDYITNPINRMRVLEGSPAVRILRQHGVLGQRRANLIEYEFQYIDPVIDRLAKMLEQWESETGPLMYAIKSAVGAEVSSHSGEGLTQGLGQYLCELKQLDFELIKTMLGEMSDDRGGSEVFDGGVLEQILLETRTRRWQILERLLSELERGGLQDQAGTIRSGFEQIQHALVWGESVQI